MESVNREPDCCGSSGELKAGPNVTIFYQLPWKIDNQPKPNPSSSTISSGEFVIMPFDLKNRIINWSQVIELLNAVLKNGIKTFDQLSDLLKSINPSLKGCSFNILKKVVDDMNNNQKEKFYDVIIPHISSSALKLPTLITQSIPILKQKMNHSLFFSQIQLTSILANAFLCTFPEPGNSKLNHFTFKELFSGTSVTRRKAEKLKCIINYFLRVATDPPKGTVTFQRRHLEPGQIPDWSNCNNNLKKLIVRPTGNIENDGRGMLQVDFAHKLVGGKTLTYGMVQEEIRFVINPELIVSMLFTEKMLDNEALVIIGAEQFNNYSGYADTFVFAGDHFDSTPLDSWSRRHSKLVAIDAIYFAVDKVKTQYSKKLINRELTKAYAGFIENAAINAKNLNAIATGNWGCGVYRGDPHLKSLIQWIAASMCNRDVVYFTFNDRRLTNMKEMINLFSAKKLNVGQLYSYLIDYGNYVDSLQPRQPMTPLFTFIERKLLHNYTD